MLFPPLPPIIQLIYTKYYEHQFTYQTATYLILVYYYDLISGRCEESRMAEQPNITANFAAKKPQN
jgi:hypothetical protein